MAKDDSHAQLRMEGKGSLQLFTVLHYQDPNAAQSQTFKKQDI